MDKSVIDIVASLFGGGAGLGILGVVYWTRRFISTSDKKFDELVGKVNKTNTDMALLRERLKAVKERVDKNDATIEDLRKKRDE